MKRRAALIVFLSSITGCIGLVPSDGSSIPSLPAVVTDFTFDLPPNVDQDPQAKPEITVDQSKREVFVEGVLYVGSNKCFEAKIGDVTYTDSTSHLTIRVVPGKSDQHPDNSLLNRSCTDVLSPDGYSISLRVTDDVEKITVRESSKGFEDRSASVSFQKF